MTGEGSPRLRDVATLFLKLGVISFGGPAAHVALMREEAVRRRNWVSDEQFLDLLGASNLIPGPTATELSAAFRRPPPAVAPSLGPVTAAQGADGRRRWPSRDPWTPRRGSSKCLARR